MTLTLPLLALFLAQLPNAVRQAELDFRSGRCDQVIESLGERLRSAPGLPPDAYLLLAECHTMKGLLDDGERTLRSGLLKHPDAVTLQKALAQALFRRNPESAEAGELFRLAVEASPGDAEALHYYSQWAYLNNMEHLCVQHERTALRQRDDLPELALQQMYTLLGMCEARLDRVTAAREAFEAAMAINLRASVFDAAQAFQYVQFLLRNGMSSAAEPVIEEVIKRSPRFGPAHLERAKILERQGRREAAVAAAKEALAGEGNSPSNLRAAHALLAKCYFILGRRAEAEAEQRWIEEHPAFGE